MDTYFSRRACVKRLLNEFRKHNQLIVAVDFDDTIFDFHQIDSTHEHVIELLREGYALGFRYVIWTAGGPERWDMMKEFFRDRICPYNHEVNKNYELPFGNHGKIYYNILLDDRAGLIESYMTLKEVIEEIKYDKSLQTS